MYDEMLALTGAGAIAIGAIQLDHWWVGAAAGALVASGVLLLRVRVRRRAQ
ncbi:hypothetical protein ACRAWB_07960 [Leifsonia poae]|uniref:hypothetical protein n=1 Tax=Leifsonia poae TaxID=110933 RepID=UPI003D69F806